MTRSGPTRAERAAAAPADHTPSGLVIGREAVLAWFAASGRDLPWRRTRDPWAVLVAESMLQQTQVSRVVGRWSAFLERYPTPAAFAARPVAVAIAEWAGLGYNRRAVDLHRTAGLIVDRHGGVVPDTVAELLALPGIGPYTARAVVVFAHEGHAGVLDTNVARIAARVTGRRLGRAAAQAVVDAAVPLGRSWDWNQALVDIGALSCRSRDPACQRCPLAPSCRWHLAGQPPPDPARGSAGVSTRQARFEGSDRQGRGRLVAALCEGPVADADLATAMGWPADPNRARAVAAGLETDGLAHRTDGTWRLGGGG